MHAGDMYSSDRLYQTWHKISNTAGGATTDEIGRYTGSRCPGTDISALRQNLRNLDSPWEIECKYERTTKRGAKVYRYRAVRRA